MIVEGVFVFISEKLSVKSNIEAFRSDVQEILMDSLDLRTDRNPQMLRNNIREYRKEAREYIWADLPFLVGLIGTLAGFQTPGFIIDPISWVIAVVGAVRGATVGLMAYEVPTERRDISELEFMRAWNKGPVSKYSNSILLPVIAVCMKIAPRGYEAGIGILRGWAEEEL
jgi:hypothetical protein